MKNILVPVDFSELSKVAARYAFGMASEHQYRIHLFTVKDINSGPHALMYKHKLESEIHQANEDDGKELARQLQAMSPKLVEITVASESGHSIYSAINDYANFNQIDLIVMGSQGASGLKKVFLGSNAAAVINYSAVPVIIVPANAVYKGINSVVYATDMAQVDREVRQIKELIYDFDSRLHIIHVVPEGSEEAMNTAGMPGEEIKTVTYHSTDFHIFKSIPVAEAIDDFVVTQQADLLALFTHKLEFLEKLFDTSVTRQLAYHNHVPLLSFNKSLSK